MSNRLDRDRDERMDDKEEPTGPSPGGFYTIKKYDGIEIMCPMLFSIYPSFDFVEDVVELIEVKGHQYRDSEKLFICIYSFLL
jgi:hypothetical protein